MNWVTCLEIALTVNSRVSLSLKDQGAQSIERCLLQERRQLAAKQVAHCNLLRHCNAIQHWLNNVVAVVLACL